MTSKNKTALPGQVFDTPGNTATKSRLNNTTKRAISQSIPAQIHQLANHFRLIGTIENQEVPSCF